MFKALFFAFCFLMACLACGRSIQSSTANEASHVVKASPGTLFYLTCYNAGSTQFILIFNASALPADGVAPSVTPMTCPGSGNCTYDFGATTGAPFGTGIVWSNSSTEQTKTIGTATVWCTSDSQ